LGELAESSRTAGAAEGNNRRVIFAACLGWDAFMPYGCKTSFRKNSGAIANLLPEGEGVYALWVLYVRLFLITKQKMVIKWLFDL